MGTEEVVSEVTMGVVTPSLLVGPVEEFSHLTTVTICETANDAFTMIRSGWTAVLPAGRWDLARETLKLLGASEYVIEDRIFFAKLGQVLHAV